MPSVSSRSLALPSAILPIAILLLTHISFAASPRPNANCPELPGNPHLWKEQEHWVWKEVCNGREANLLVKYGGSAGPATEKDWPAQRDLTQQFLSTILSDDAFRKSIPRQGITIVGAQFREEINLVNAILEHDFNLSRSRFGRMLNMRGLQAQGSVLVLDGYFAGANEAMVLAGATIRGNLDLDGSWVAEPPFNAETTFNMDSLTVEGNLAMRRASFDHVWLANAKIGGELDMSATTVKGELRMLNLNVRQDLKLQSSVLTTVLLINAAIGRDLAIEGPRIANCIARAKPWSRPQLPPQSVDLTGTTVGGTLSFGSPCYGPIDTTNWGAGASLSLRNASVHTLEDGIVCRASESHCPNTWPEHLELNGFAYQELGRFIASGNNDMAARRAEWWIDWLGRHVPYSPQPYEYLASTLSKRGYKDKAKDILYEGKNRELKESHYPEKAWLWLMRAFIGYGYRPHYALWWVIAFALLGAVVLRLSGEGPRNKLPYGIAFSFDMLLPIIKLREYHYGVDLKGWVRYYFYFHKLMGYVLASFLIAGLSGLTK